MAEFSVVSRKKKTAAPTQELTQEDQSSLLQKAGAGAMSGLHTLGSILSHPSRLLHGAINAAVGGKEGFGENYLNPFDSRGGVEGSRHLINAGILPENDPHTWEWSDLGRGLADLALDPTTYAGPGLTKLGLASMKKGTLAAGRVAQHAAGERALLNIGLPFAAPAISIGTGPGTAKALQNIGKYSGLTRVAEAAKKSFPVRAALGTFDSRYMGVTHPELQPEVFKQSDVMRATDKAADANAIRAGREAELAPTGDPFKNQESLRRAVEGVEKPLVETGFAPHPAIGKDPLVPHVTVRINPQGKIVEHLGAAVDGGHLDDILKSGEKVTAPFMHLDAAGKPVIGKGMVHPKHVKEAAEAAHKADLEALAAKGMQVPTWADEAVASNAPFSAVKAIQENFPEALNTAHVPFRDIAKVTGKTPQEIVEALDREIPGGYSKHKHDFPSEIVHEGKQGDFFWHPKEPGSLGSYDTPFIGFSLRPETGKAIAEQAATAVPAARQLHPEKLAAIAEHDALSGAGAAENIAKHSQRIIDEIQAGHGSEEAMSMLAKMRDAKQPGMLVNVPKHQAKEIQRQFAGGPVERIPSADTLAIQKHPEFKNMMEQNAHILAENQRLGVGAQHGLSDTAVGSHFPRHQSVTAEKQAGGMSRGSAVMAAKTAEDTGRKWFLTGHYGGTVGMNKAISDPAVHDAFASGGVKAAVEELTHRHGPEIDALYKNPKQVRDVAKAKQTVDDISGKVAETDKSIKGNADLLDMLKSSDMSLPTNHQAFKEATKLGDKLKKTAEQLKYEHGAAQAAHTAAEYAGKDRIKAIAEYIGQHPELKGKDLFGNHPVVDAKMAAMSASKKHAMAPAVYRALAKNLNKGDGAMSLGEFLKTRGYNLRAAAENIAGRKFDTPKELKAFLKGNTVDSKLAEAMKTLVPSYKAPDAVNEVTNHFKSFMAWWKGQTLAFPSSRTRDAVGGVVWNLMHGWGKPSFYKDAMDVLTGKIVKTDYSHVPEIKEWLAKTGRKWSHENQTEAMKQLIANHVPSEHGILGEVPVKQVGAGIDQITHNVPGQQKTNIFNQFIGDPLKALVGRDPGGASWLGKAEPGESLAGRVGRAVQHPFKGIRGVGDQAETMFAPVKASEIVANNSDAYNRSAPFMQMLHEGYKADVAAAKVNRAQIDYNPATYTATERAIKNYVSPFYSFQSRIIPETARELSNFGSPTSQVIKAVNRAQGDDASVPDYITSGTGIPLGTRDDGSKAYMTNLGQMYEPAVSDLGLMAGAVHDPRALGALGYDTLAKLNPLIGTPLQRITGQSFFQRGAPIRDLDPIAGRMLSNIGEATGMLPEGSRPIEFPGSSYVDTVLGATPFGRMAGTVRTLADPRKDLGSKLANTMTGFQIADVSPAKQQATLQKRAEDLARSQGAWEQRTVGFPKEQLAKLAETNPELAKKQQHLQNMITGIKRKRTAQRKEKAKEKAKADQK